MTEPSGVDKRRARSALKEGEPCPACQKIIRYPLSHVCDSRKVDASIVNDVGDYVVCLGEEKHRFSRAEFIALVRSGVPSANATIPAGLPDDNDGKEQDEFEGWAKTSGYDMAQHPIHWLFLNKETAAARHGWRAAIGYCRKMVAAYARCEVVATSKVQE